MNKNSEDRTVINDLFCILSTLSLHYCGRFDFNFSVDSRGKTLTITISHYHLHQLKTLRYLLAVIYVRCLSRIFIRSVCLLPDHFSTRFMQLRELAFYCNLSCLLIPDVRFHVLSFFQHRCFPINFAKKF